MGNRTSATEASRRTLNWSYDGIYRLNNESIANDPAGKDGAVSYSLDPVGNRLSDTSSLSGIFSGNLNFNADDLLSTESYDANGNVVASGGRSFAYDSENQLKSMNGTAAALQYDADGNLVAEAASGVTTHYLVDDLNPTGYSQVVEEIVNGSVQRQYSYGLQRIDENQIVNNAWTPSFYGYDGGGSVRQLTNLDGVVTDTYSYDAFGNLLSSTGTTPNHYLYRGEQYDQALNLYYLRARHYNPTTGRFMGRDAADGDLDTPASLHKYAYVSGDPVNRIDPSGNDAVADYGSVTLNISLSRAVIIGLKVTAAAIACLDLYEGAKTYAESVAGPLGHVVTFPCGAIAIRNSSPPAIAPPLVYPVIAGTAPGPDGKCEPGDELHHMLPQEFTGFFSSKPRYMNINDSRFLRCVPKRCHRLKSGNGLHTNQDGPGSNYNALWQQFIDQNQGASEQQVLFFLGKMALRFAAQLICGD